MESKKKVGAKKIYKINPTPISVRVGSEQDRIKIRTLEKKLLKNHQIQ